MPARTRARQRALEVLYEADLRGVPAPEVLAARQEARRAAGDTPMNDYVRILVEGVVAHRERIDELLATYAEGWSLDRMPPVDRNVLRLGAFELLWQPDVPDAVALDEAATLAATLSGEAAPDFVHGLLARLRDLKPTLSV